MRGLMVGVLLAAACGGAQKTSKGEMSEQARGAAPPPSDVKPVKINRKVSTEAKGDFADAVKFFKQQEKNGWKSGDCAAAAEKFMAVAESHDKLVEAYFNAGVAYQRCGDTKKAEGLYKKALAINPGHAPSLANLGEIYYRGGNTAVGEQYFQKAIQADQKITAARNSLAYVLYQRLRQSRENKYADEALAQLSRVLAVDNDNIVAYTIMALVYLEKGERQRSALDVAKLLLEEGRKRNDKYAPLYNAWGLLHMKRANVGEALKMFRQAVALDPDFIEARMNVAQVVLSFRKYQEAEENFRMILDKKELAKETRYDATIGLAVALRGQKKIDEAAQLYEEAMKLIPERGDAFYNMGLLWKDFKTDSADPKENKLAFVKAKGYFNQFMGKAGGSSAEKKDEARDNIESCDKNIAALDQAIEAMSAQPPPPPPAAPAAPAGGKP